MERPRPPVGDDAVAFILQEDQDLAERLPEHHREEATTLLRASVLDAGPGSWTPPQLNPATSLGLLLLDGLVARRVDVAGGLAIEILGPGDIVRPAEDRPLADAGPGQPGWQVLKRARFAVLDVRITALITRSPELSLAVADRLVRRTGRLSIFLALSHLRRIEDRLLGTLLYLAASWGRVTARGLTVPISLTHQTLGELAGAQRPSVTLALATLREQGVVDRTPDGAYVLCGEHPLWRQSPFEQLAAASGLRSSRSGR